MLDNSALKNRIHLNRKRQHQSVEMRDERLQTEKISGGKEADRGQNNLILCIIIYFSNAEIDFQHLS